MLYYTYAYYRNLSNCDTRAHNGVSTFLYVCNYRQPYIFSTFQNYYRLVFPGPSEITIIIILATVKILAVAIEQRLH